MQKLYCYVDETGQDTKGHFFLVSVVITEHEREQLQTVLEQIERETKKGIHKWFKTPFERRLGYLQILLDLPLLEGKIFFAHYSQAQAYLDFTIATTAEVIHRKTKGIKEGYETTVLVDGLTRKQEKEFGAELRRLRIRTRKVKGIREASDPLMRLADAIAGFIRDVLEGQAYTQELYQKAMTRGTIQEV